jgi:hypothetical protein
LIQGATRVSGRPRYAVVDEATVSFLMSLQPLHTPLTSAPTMTDRDTLTRNWLEAERQAVAAEQDLQSFGQAAATPEYRDQAVRAADLRREADALFSRLHMHLRASPPPD